MLVSDKRSKTNSAACLVLTALYKTFQGTPLGHHSCLLRGSCLPETGKKLLHDKEEQHWGIGWSPQDVLLTEWLMGHLGWWTRNTVLRRVLQFGLVKQLSLADKKQALLYCHWTFDYTRHMHPTLNRTKLVFAMRSKHYAVSLMSSPCITPETLNSVSVNYGLFSVFLLMKCFDVWVNLKEITLGPLQRMTAVQNFIV